MKLNKSYYEERERLHAEEIVVSDINSIYQYITDLSYAGQGCLSLYWDICQKRVERVLVNARHLIHIRIGSGSFRSKYGLLPSNKNYQTNQWKWVRKILVKLTRMGLVSVEPIGSSPPLGIQPGRNFQNADYILRPRVSKLVFRFPNKGGEISVEDVVSAHKFIMRFVPRHIPPRYVPRSALKRSTMRKIKKAKGRVIIQFPFEA